MLSSHNLSCAAWGKLEKQGSQLHIMHYEVSELCSCVQSRQAVHPLVVIEMNLTSHDRRACSVYAIVLLVEELCVGRS